MAIVYRMKAWLGLWIVGAVVTFTLNVGDSGVGFWAVIGLALYSGALWVLVVWRTGLTPSSAWKRLNEPPREDL